MAEIKYETFKSRPMIRVNICSPDGKPVWPNIRALIDTGADRSLIPRFIYNLLVPPDDREKGNAFVTRGSDGDATSRRVTKAIIEFGDTAESMLVLSKVRRTDKAEAEIAPGTEDYCVLGIDYLRKFNLHLKGPEDAFRLARSCPVITSWDE